ncbi:Rne/Rng family ribonuclease [Parablastomonas sp. CN1-191]|uniref:Rne/Rng family ribonuclease n=1 Tax=Parablastomonas sp. CN1-191 TaxID=3400908 RepID=UPI003BF89017
MTTRMMIDARHPEETRVAVLKGNRIEEFDFESAEHKQIKGNIYLAKVTRVEPSLQAAFVDFGGNRHGFLAFSEIHPDYYQIPKEDREALLEEEARHAEEEAALRAAEDGDDDDFGSHGDDDETASEDDNGGVIEIDTSEKDEVATIEDGHVDGAFDHAAEEEAEGEAGDDRRGRRGRRRQGGRSQAQAKQADDLRDRRMALRRRYKIQDVIQRRQVLLVQVVKEERGNKGAALTTYLSLAGRYCVLMPNSSHGGGISRKISSAADRKRLKSIISELDLPKSMGCIVRTAGLQRTKPEIKRDFDYLARLWDEIREKTLGSSAPALIHSDSDLIKRAIRDIYNKDIEEVIVEGERGYRAARDFMKLLMPSHVKKVAAYSDPVPLFQRYGAEDQLSAMYDPEVQLKSGGYIVINPTEALVSIDINSGRSTKEHGIEATALNTNLEAAREIARQLRLRDMAGLVVIDFIDMEYGSNVRKVEKAMKDALKNDRARIQVGRISGFGLMEMSRQRLRTGVLEATTRSCPHCDGTGLVRTASSAGLSALRLIEDEAAKGRGSIISLYASTEAAVYLLNAKRSDLAEIEDRYGVRVEVIPEGENEGAKMRVGSSGPRPEYTPKFAPIAVEEDDEVVVEDEDYGDEEEVEVREDDGDNDRRGRRGRGGRRRRGGRRDEEGSTPRPTESTDDGDENEGEADESRATGEDDDEAPRKRRRRGRRRRGGRGRGDGEGENGAEALDGDGETAPSDANEPVVAAEPVAEPALEKPRRSRRRKADVSAQVSADDGEVAAEAIPAMADTPISNEPAPEAAAPKPRRSRKKVADPAVETAAEAPAAEAAPAAEEAPAKPKRTRKKAVAADAVPAVAETPVSEEPVTAANASAADASPAEDDSDEPRRGGWWQRTFGA